MKNNTARVGADRPGGASQPTVFHPFCITPPLARVKLESPRLRVPVSPHLIPSCRLANHLPSLNIFVLGMRAATIPDRGRNRGSTLPLPPNWTGEFLASSSPVSGPLYEPWPLWLGLRLRRLTRVPRNRHWASADDPGHEHGLYLCAVCAKYYAGARVSIGPGR